MLDELKVKIGADMKQFERAIQDVSQKINGFTSQINKFATNVKQKMKDSEKAFDDFADKNQRVGESLQTFGEQMTTFVALPMALAGAASIKLASDMSESLNKVNVSFGTSAKEVIDWSETSIEKMGLAAGTALDAAALFGDMATSMGISRDRAADMAMSLTQLGADLASFKNIPIEQAMQALNGVFTGETESLKMLGVVMTETQLKAFALTQGITKNVDKMTEAEVVSLRYAFVLDRTKNAQGDFARTSDGAANQMRMFTENLKELGAKFGEILIPAFTVAITSLNKMLKAFSELSPVTQGAIFAIGGTTATIGLLSLAVGAVLAKLKDLKEFFQDLVLVFGKVTEKVKPMTRAIVLLQVALVAFYAFFEPITETLGKFMQIAKQTLEGLVVESKLAVNEFTIIFNKLKLYSVDTIFSILKSFRFFSIELSNLKNEIKDTIALEEFERKSLKASLALTNLRMEAIANSETWKEHLKKVNENAGKTDYLSKSYMALGESAKVFQAKVTDSNKPLGDASKSAEELAKKQDELRKKTLESANALGDAIVTALKNKVNAEQDAIKSLKQTIESNKTNYDKMVADVKDAQREITQTIKDEYDKQQSIINGTYDKLADDNNASFDQQIKANRERINQIKDNNEQERQDLIDEKYKSNVKALSADEDLLKDRLSLVASFEKLALDREAQALADNRIIRLEAFEALTDEENKSIRDKVLAQRQLQISGLENTNGLLFDAQQQENARIEAERTNELAKIRKEYEDKNFEVERYVKLRTELMDVFYQAELRNNKMILDEQTKNVKTLDTEIELQQKALELAIPKNQNALIALLKQYNPDWLKAGKDFGEQLLTGLNSQKQSIESAVQSILSKVASVKNAQVETPAKTESTTENKLKEVKVESKAVSGSKANVNDIKYTDTTTADWIIKNLKPVEIGDFKKVIKNESVQKENLIDKNIPFNWLIKNTKPFANGGIVTSPTLAMIGEAGESEAVIPLSRLGDFMGSNETKIYLDGREITRSVAPHMVDHLRTKLGVVY